MKKLPIGVSDFREIITGGYYYIDKSQLINELYATGKVTLISRPRRFGKTLNLSMLHYFFEYSLEKNDSLFEGLAIYKSELFAQQQGKYPVIFVSFKNITHGSLDQMLNEFAFEISQEYSRHKELLSSTDLAPHEKELFQKLVQRKASKEELAHSLSFLSLVLARHYKMNVILLIDEYDVPIQSAYVYGFYDEALQFVRQLLTTVLKDNKHLYKGVLTGIMTLAKAGIFSGLNNLDIYNVTHDGLADTFGFTLEEVQNMAHYFGVEDISGIKKWYNGYTFGKRSGLLNPWSVIKCIQNKGSLESYWVNTSDNILLKRLIARASSETKAELESLMRGETIDKTIEESIVYVDIDRSSHIVWSILLFTGYLTYSKLSIKEGKKNCTLVIPNEEIRFLYRDLIRQLFTDISTGARSKDLLRALLQGESAAFSELLQNFVVTFMSVYDVATTEPERSYHLFILGLLVMLSESYEIRSNRESGLGRYDIMIIPKHKADPAAILEFKRVWKKTDIALDQAAQIALEQIIEKKYAQELYDQGIQTIQAYGIAFEGKNISMRHCTLSST